MEFEKPQATVVSVGGQAANNLVLPLSQLGHNLLGTSATNINQAEDRQLFSQLLHDADIDQPHWINATSSQQIVDFVAEVGFPVIVRPSYVPSGAAMKVATNHEDLEEYLASALKSIAF